jgi:hypothetical protein
LSLPLKKGGVAVDWKETNFGSIFPVEPEKIELAYVHTYTNVEYVESVKDLRYSS